FLPHLYLTAFGEPYTSEDRTMKSGVGEARSHASEVQRISPERLHSARTVPQRVAHPGPVSRRLFETVGLDDLAAQLPGPEHQRGVAHVRPALKVAYVVDQFPRSTHGFLLQEILELESRGIDVNIFSLRMPDGRVDDTACALARLRGPVRYFPESGACGAAEGLSIDIASMPRGMWATAAQWIAQQVTARSIEHLHAHGAMLPTEVARDSARLSGRGYSFTAYADGLYDGADESGLCEKVLNARFGVTLTEIDRRRLLKVCGAWAAGKLYRIPMSLNSEDYRFSGPEYHDSDSILAVGPLVEKSGFSDLIEAVGLLRDRGRVARLTIFGEGELEEALREQINRCQLAGRVQLLCDLSRNQLSMLMRAH